MPHFRSFPAAFKHPRGHTVLAPPRGRLFGLMLCGLAVACLCLAAAPMLAGAQSAPPAAVSDPGVRGGVAGAGQPLPLLLLPAASAELKFFNNARDVFNETDSVSGTEPGANSAGLGPRFNMNSCGGCHAQPAIGGSSPTLNPQVAVATHYGATNIVPPFIASDGPVREVRFKLNPDDTPDGGVHDLFTITGRKDAPGCNIAQPNFSDRDNIIFRIPTPVFGAGLIEAIPDSAIMTNQKANPRLKALLGIAGEVNRDGNTGTVARFGWKAQNKSLELFAGEAYNVEQGVTNEIFQNERDETPACMFNGIPEDHTNFNATGGTAVLSDVVNFAVFMRFLDQPTPALSTPSTERGRQTFTAVGCGLCHTPSLQTGLSSTAALSNQTVNLFSDLLVHKMGTNLADGISQGSATGDEFRTAPLWGLGQRAFFLHDGRTKNLMDAIQAHSSPGSEANVVVSVFNDALTSSQKQDVLNFLRSL